MTDHDEAFDFRLRCAVDGHGLRKRPHWNHPCRIRRRVIQREVGRLVIRFVGGHRHLAKACLGGTSHSSGRQQKRNTGRCKAKREGTKSKEGTGKHEWISFGLGCAAGISRPKYQGAFAWRHGGATKCRSGAPGEKCARERRSKFVRRSGKCSARAQSFLRAENTLANPSLEEASIALNRATPYRSIARSNSAIANFLSSPRFGMDSPDDTSVARHLNL